MDLFSVVVSPPPPARVVVQTPSEFQSYIENSIWPDIVVFCTLATVVALVAYVVFTVAR